MTQDEITGNGFRFTGWHMLGVVFLFFGTIIAVNFYMAYNAIHTWTGLVVENSYVASQEFNTKLATAREQVAQGWTGGLAYENQTLVFSLTDGMGQPLNADKVRVEISRPVGIRGDRTLELTQTPDGSFTAPIELDPGVWIAAIVAHFPNQPDYEHHARLVVGETK